MDPTNERVFLQGGGDHARVVLDCLQDQGIKVAAIFDPKYSGELFGVPQLGKYDPSFDAKAKAVIAIGDNVIRKKVVESCKHGYINVVHKTAVLSKRATFGHGIMILHRAIVQARSVIGDHVIINTAAQVDHDCIIGNYTHLAPGSILCGSVTVGEGAFLGAGAVVIPGKKVGAWATVGAGAVVVDDIPDGAVAVGNPARIIKQEKQ